MRLLVGGHSIPAGANKEDPGLGWVHILARNHPQLHIDNRAIGSSTAKDWAYHHLSPILKEHLTFDAIAVHMLGNDVLLGLADGKVSIEEWLLIHNSLVRVVAQLRDAWPKAKLLIVGECDPFDRHSRNLVHHPDWQHLARVSDCARFLDIFLPAVCRRHGAIYVDLHQLFMNHCLGRHISRSAARQALDPPYLTLADPDHPDMDDIVHPVTAGHSAIARAVASALGQSS